MDVDRWVSSTEGHPVKHAAPGEVKQKRVCSSCFLNAVVEVEQRMGAAAAAPPVAEGVVGFVSEEGVPPGTGGQWPCGYTCALCNNRVVLASDSVLLSIRGR